MESQRPYKPKALALNPSRIPNTCWRARIRDGSVGGSAT